MRERLIYLVISFKIPSNPSQLHRSLPPLRLPRLPLVIQEYHEAAAEDVPGIRLFIYKHLQNYLLYGKLFALGDWADHLEGLRGADRRLQQQGGGQLQRGDQGEEGGGEKFQRKFRRKFDLQNVLQTGSLYSIEIQSLPMHKVRRRGGGGAKYPAPLFIWAIINNFFVAFWSSFCLIRQFLAFTGEDPGGRPQRPSHRGARAGGRLLSGQGLVVPAGPAEDQRHQPGESRRFLKKGNLCWCMPQHLKRALVVSTNMGVGAVGVLVADIFS